MTVDFPPKGTLRDFEQPGRSPARGSRFMAATSHPAATTVALDVLSTGGNAVDAALAAAGVLSVVEPHMTGIGGDMFALIAEPSGHIHGINGSGPAPAALNAAMMRDQGFETMPERSPHAVTVPGALAGFDHMASHFGTRAFGDLLEPATRLARDGFPITDRVAFDFAMPHIVPGLSAHPGARTLFVKPDGTMRGAGEMFANPPLAQTLETIAQNGISSFYQGEIADHLIATLKALGGVMAGDDLARMEAFPVTPITADYRGLTIAELPPNGQGIVALIILKLLERFDLADLDPHGAERVHLETEATRLAYSVRNAYIADPDRMSVGTDDLLSDATIDALFRQIDRKARNRQITVPDIARSGTVYLTTADEEGRLVSLIYSIFGDFGSMIACEKTGVLFQNRGSAFSLEEGHPNELTGGARPLHTIIPAMALKDGVPVIAFGVMGGAYQACGHAHVITNMVDYGMDPQAALDAPRAFFGDGDDVFLERGYLAEVHENLAALGHRPSQQAKPIGGGQMIMRDPATGQLVGGSDPRKDGAALGL